MTRPFLIIQLRPEDEISDNEFEKIRYYGELQNHEVERFRIEKFKLPDMDLGRYSGVIVGGSPFDLSTPSRDKSALQQRIEADFRSLFDVLVAEDFPFLGCCSGSGLLGSYCGVRISTRFGEAVSGVDVTITEAGRHDPLLKGMPKFIRVLLGHKEACDELPPEASLLIEGKECPVQMFRLKSNIYATQFHPEGDPEGFAVRINAYKHHGYFAPETVTTLINRLSNEKAPHAQQILKRFVARYRR